MAPLFRYALLHVFYEPCTLSHTHTHAHPSSSSVPITVLLYNGLLLYCVNVPIKGFKMCVLTELLHAYLLENHKDDIRDILLQTDSSEHSSVVIK